jgi:hypothetical protein
LATSIPVRSRLGDRIKKTRDETAYDCPLYRVQLLDRIGDYVNGSADALYFSLDHFVVQVSGSHVRWRIDMPEMWNALTMRDGLLFQQPFNEDDHRARVSRAARVQSSQRVEERQVRSSRRPLALLSACMRRGVAKRDDRG